MNSALWLLMRLQTRGMIRRALRKAGTVKGAFFIVVAVVLFGGWLASVAFTMKISQKSDPAVVRSIAPAALLLMCAITLISGGDRSISFTQGEVNFLFPGPFSRRELLLFKLARTFVGALFSGLILSVVFLKHASSYPASLIASVLAMTLVQVLGLVVSVAARSVNARMYSTGRRVLLIAVGVIIAAFAVSQGRGMFQGGFLDGLKQLIQTPVVKAVTVPVMPFILAFTAQTVPQLLLWSAVALLINVLLIALLLWLDADYREASLAASQKVFEQRERVRRGQVMPHVVARPGKRRDGLPMFPFLRGAGPTAWRQFTTAFRIARGTLLFMLIMVSGMIPAMYAAKGNVGPIVGAGVWMTIMLTTFVKFDFRAELDQMDWLKSLPLSPTATAAGQLAAPILMLTSVQSLLLGFAVYFATPTQRPLLLFAWPILIPFNAMMLAIDNLLFLLYPARAPAAPGDLAAMGRAVLLFMLKILAVFVACIPAGIAGAVAYFAFGRSAVAMGAGIFLSLSVVAITLAPCVGWAFRRFDPSFDTPA